MHIRAAAALFLGIGLVPLPAQAPAAPAAPPKARQEPTDAKDKTPSDFARFVTAGAGGHLDTAITTYRNADGVEVQLIGALHIADGRYYEALEQRFATLPTVLYELVGPEDYRPQKGERSDSFVSLLQRVLENGLELEFQLDAIDYAAPNFVHADMTPDEFRTSMAERGETLLGLLAKMMLAGAGAPRGEGAAAAQQVDLVQAFRSGEGRHRLRMAMAAQLEQIENLVAVAGGTTLLEGRNEKCLEVLQAQIKAGRKKLGIFYGAAHLPQMEHRLVDDLGFRKVDHEWLVAWDCTPRPDPKADPVLWARRRQAKDEVAAIAEAVQQWRLGGGAGTPALAELAAPRAAGEGPWYAGAIRDPWGHEYAITGFPVPPGFDVQCSGQDGVAGNDDDIHSASPIELRHMRRAAQKLAPPKGR